MLTFGDPIAPIWKDGSASFSNACVYCHSLPGHDHKSACARPNPPQHPPAGIARVEDGEEPDTEARHTGTDGEKRNAPAGDARPQAPTTLDDPTDPQLHKDTAAQRTPAATASGSPPRDNNRQQTSDTQNNAQTPRAAAAACTKSLLNAPDGPMHRRLRPRHGDTADP